MDQRLPRKVKKPEKLARALKRPFGRHDRSRKPWRQKTRKARQSIETVSGTPSTRGSVTTVKKPEKLARALKRGFHVDHLE